MDRHSHFVSSPGFSLIELLVVMAVLAVTLSLTLPPFYQSLTRTNARTSAQTLQCATSAAQLRQLACGGTATVQVDAVGLTIAGPGSDTQRVEMVGAETSANVSRWCVGAGVSVGYGGDFAAPDSAGSIYLGPAGLETRVVIRAESGFTYRAAR